MNDHWRLRLKSALKRNIPDAAIHVLKKIYYPRMLKHFPEERWPLSVVVKHLLQPGDVAVDVGANIGYVTLLLSKWVGRDGRVISFEPVPQTYELLRHNLRCLHVRNVTAINLGLSSESGIFRMCIPVDQDGVGNYYEARMANVPSSPHPKNSVLVEVGRLDSYLPEVPARLSFIKIDVEGHELEVLQGSERILRSVKPALLIEVNGSPDEPETKTHHLFRLLAGMKYEAYHWKDGLLQERRPGEIPGDCFFLQSFHCGKLAATGLAVASA